MVSENLTEKIVEKVELAAEVGTKVANIVGNAFETTIADVDHSPGADEDTWSNYFMSFGIHIAMVIIVILLKWQYDRNRYRYPKGPRDWRNIKDAISFHRNKRENLLALATDYPDNCTVMTHVGRLVLLNDPKLINEIFIGRADLVSNKVDGYLENQLRYKEGKHIRTGIVFRHQDHNVRIIHKALVDYLDDKRIDSIVQEELKQMQLSEKFDVRRTTFYFAVRFLTTLTCSSAVPLMNDKTFQLFEQNLYKISKAIYADTLEKSAKAALTQLTGLSETLDINENVLDYIKTWVQYRRNQTNVIGDTNNEQTVTSTTKNNDFLESILNVIDESSPRLDEDDVAACVLDIIMHGSEMLKGALSWLLLYVVKYPEEADICRREARDNGYSTFNLSSAESLVHTQAFVKEVLRLSPIVPIVIHSTLEDFRWRNFHIQKRTQFGANIIALHHSIAWKDANNFDLTRWLGDNASMIPTHSYAPFGFGARACIAEKHLFNLLTGILAVLLYHNDFEKTAALPQPTEGTFGLANMPPKYSLKATPLSARS
jgi:cytochrome P450